MAIENVVCPWCGEIVPVNVFAEPDRGVNYCACRKCKRPIQVSFKSGKVTGVSR
jgi:hypothetical protein